ncbi:type IV pilus major pilin [Salmonella enterica]|uniref:type IV pilus major pilin n=1 Tax=Salmonella enterica TaxID=28901 RepID=UPI0003BCB6A4|nr:type IV pilus major pilin [Salmonella enterica]EBI1927245.1 type IV pilus major pilin [Salmonella enterica]ESG76344.1 type IV major pilin [Salmonella enterica subsp. enterica serovar Muenchen str. baa1594]
MNTLKMAEIRKKLSEKLKRYRALKKQRGMTLLEIIIVLGIIGTIAAGVVVLAQRAYDSKAMTDLVTNTNTIRTAIKETYGPTGIYPDEQVAGTLALTDATINNVAGADIPPIAQLVQLGKLSTSEAKNNISSNYFNIGNAHVGTAGAGAGATAIGDRAYFIEVNGLDQKQCRNIMLQVGNQWDYVEVHNTAGSSGAYASGDHLNLQAAAVAGGNGAGGVVRSLANTGNVLITPALANGFCSDSAANSLVLGSR